MSFRTKPRAQRYTNSHSRGGVTSSSQTPSLVEEEAPFQNT
jgi:hypothetical protein